MMLHRLLIALVMAGLLVLPASAQNNRYRIIFSSDRDTGNTWQLYTMNADGTGARRLLESDFDDYGAQVSPNGQFIAFNRRDASGYSEIYLLNVFTEEITSLVPGSNPAWSPDGERIAYTSLVEGNAEVYTVGVDGTFPQPFTANPRQDYGPAWSPDGEFIAFKSNRDGETAIYTARADRTELAYITDADDSTHPIAWSPDGSEILFTRKLEGRSAVHIVEVESGDTRRLLDTDTANLLPVWSPDGSEVLLVMVEAHQPEIYRVNADGTDLTRLTENEDWDWHPTIIPGAVDRGIR